MVVHWWGLTFKQQSNFLFLSEVWFVLGTPLWVRNPQSYAGKNVFLFIFTQIICTSDVISPPKYRQPRFLLYLDAFPQYGPVWFTLVVRGVWLELARLEICFLRELHARVRRVCLKAFLFSWKSLKSLGFELNFWSSSCISV